MTVASSIHETERAHYAELTRRATAAHYEELARQAVKQAGEPLRRAMFWEGVAGWEKGARD